MIDGFFIEENRLVQAPSKVANEEASLLKRHSLAIVVSVLVHIFLVFLLFVIAEKPQPKQVKVNKKAIKSYLYQIPTKSVPTKSVSTKLKEVKEQTQIDNVVEKPKVEKNSKNKKSPNSIKLPNQRHQRLLY